MLKVRLRGRRILAERREKFGGTRDRGSITGGKRVPYRPCSETGLPMLSLPTVMKSPIANPNDIAERIYEETSTIFPLVAPKLTSLGSRLWNEVVHVRAL